MNTTFKTVTITAAIIFTTGCTDFVLKTVMEQSTHIFMAMELMEHNLKKYPGMCIHTDGTGIVIWS